MHELYHNRKSIYSMQAQIEVVACVRKYLSVEQFCIVGPSGIVSCLGPPIRLESLPCWSVSSEMLIARYPASAEAIDLIMVRMG